MKSVSVVFDLKIGDVHKVAVTRTVIHPDYVDEENKFNVGDIAIIFLAAHEFPTVIIPFDRGRDLHRRPAIRLPRLWAQHLGAVALDRCAPQGLDRRRRLRHAARGRAEAA